MVTIVGTVRGSVVVVGFGKNEDVVAATEWIFENCSGTKVDVGIVGRSLIGG